MRTGIFFKFFRRFNDFITQKVYFSRWMHGTCFSTVLCWHFITWNTDIGTEYFSNLYFPICRFDFSRLGRGGRGRGRGRGGNNGGGSGAREALNILFLKQILVRFWMRIQILWYAPFTNRSGCGCGSGSGSFRQWPSRCQQKIFFFL